MPVLFDLKFASLMVCSLCAPGFFHVARALANEPRVRVVQIDGSADTCAWLGSSDGTHLQVRTAAGRKVIPFDELSEIAFEVPETTVAVEAEVTLHLADGGRLRADLIGVAADAVVARTALGESVSFPFDRLSGVQLAGRDPNSRAGELFFDALGRRLAGWDVLVTRSPDQAETTIDAGRAGSDSRPGGRSSGARTLRGRVVELEKERCVFEFEGRPRTIGRDKVFGVVFAAGVARQPAYQITLDLTEGSCVSGRLLSADADTVRIETSVGVETELPLTAVSAIRVHSKRVVYLSDLEPVGQRLEGRLHRPWPIQRDRSVSGGPLSINGRVFSKGLGVHSRTELAYDLSGKYEKLAATIGIDDAVRPNGSVRFVVQGDDRSLYESGLLDGRADARDVIVNVSNVKILTLVVDYGDSLDLADHADWGDARLLKPASTRRAGLPDAGER